VAVSRTNAKMHLGASKSAVNYRISAHQVQLSLANVWEYTLRQFGCWLSGPKESGACAAEDERMELVWLAALILGVVAAVAGGPGARGKLVNAAIIIGCMSLGFGIGYAAGLGSENMGRVRDAGLMFALVLGIVGSLSCMKLNSSRIK
jgi:hypothetical protein